MPITYGPRTFALLAALRDVQWMARRAASAPGTGSGERTRVDEGTWGLTVLLAEQKMEPLRPDRVANRRLDAAGAGTASVFTDGTGEEFTAEAESVVAWQELVGEDRIQWIVDRLHPAAFAYADGRATYATSLCNAATATLRNAGIDLSATTARHGRVWARDAMGPQFAGLRVLPGDTSTPARF